MSRLNVMVTVTIAFGTCPTPLITGTSLKTQFTVAQKVSLRMWSTNGLILCLDEAVVNAWVACYVASSNSESYDCELVYYYRS